MQNALTLRQGVFIKGPWHCPSVDGWESRRRLQFDRRSPTGESLPGLNRVDSPQLAVDSKNPRARMVCALFAFSVLNLRS
jgi:hypothetical protein